jgi:hypothetical protein
MPSDLPGTSKVRESFARVQRTRGIYIERTFTAVLPVMRFLLGGCFLVISGRALQSITWRDLALRIGTLGWAPVPDLSGKQLQRVLGNYEAAGFRVHLHDPFEEFPALHLG